MKITSVEAIPLRLPEITNDVDGTQDDLLIRIDADEGITGWGEVDSSPTIARAVVDAPMSHGICCGLRDILLGEDPLSVSQRWEDMCRRTAYYGRFGPAIHTMSGVDLALWDIAGKAAGKPVHELLGGSKRDRVLAYASALMPDTPEAARARAASFRERGFRAMKFGWGPIGGDAVLDRELFSAVRDGAGPQATIMIDAGQCYSVEEALGAAEVLEKLRAAWLEEPLDPDDLEGYARLCAASAIPIAAGEAESGYPAFRRLIEQGCVHVVQPDLSRAGGFTVARRVAALGEAHRRRVIPHAYKSNILLAASLHFCAAFESADLLEYSTSISPIRLRLTHQDFPLQDGFVRVPDAPGLGVDIDAEVLKELQA
jgi:L-rhamnonate dehydratase